MSSFKIGDRVRVNTDGRLRLIHCFKPNGTGTLNVDHVYEVCEITECGNLILRGNGYVLNTNWTANNWELAKPRIKINIV